MNQELETPVSESQSRPEISDTQIGWDAIRLLARFASDEPVRLEAAKILLGIRS
jgi:hypothetical protein